MTTDAAWDRRRRKNIASTSESLDSHYDLPFIALTQSEICRAESTQHLEGTAKVDHLKHSWPALGMKCPFCSHIKCRACPEVSVNVLACCVCRGRAVRRLAYLEEMYRLGKESQAQAAAAETQSGGEDAAGHPIIFRPPAR